MDKQRISFFIICVLLLFSVKAYLSLQMVNPVVCPDERVYLGFAETFHISDITLYRAIPYFFGYHGALIANCLITSLCIIPLFYILRRNLNERNAAIASAALSLYAPLWSYSLTNMVEPMVFLSMLIFVLKPVLGFISPIIKAFESAVFCALLPYPFGEGLALIGGLIFMFSFPLTGDWNINIVTAIWRSYSYVVIGSLGTFCLLTYRMLKHQDDEIDRFVWRIGLMSALILFPLAFRIPYQYFYGRYLDGFVLICLATNIRPIKADRKQLMAIIGVMVLVAGLFYTVLQVNGGGVLDSAILPFYDIIKSELNATNYDCNITFVRIINGTYSIYTGLGG
jgi:hypothetical protein